MARKVQNTPPRDAEGRFQPRRSTWNAAAQSNSRRGPSMTTGLLSLVGGTAIGPAIMYRMDTESGQYRPTQALDAAHSAYEGATDMLGNAWDTVSHKASDLSESAAAAMPAMPSLPSRKEMRRSGHNMLASARSYMPHFGQHSHG